MPRDERLRLIKTIEEKRGSKLIAFVTSDRPNLSAPMSDDCVPIINEHLLAFAGGCPQIDLFIYSRGGSSDVPWTLVSMFREYCPEGSLGVLIPYKAHSAATLVALGADEIIMSKKGELGPIDITMGGHFNPKDHETKKSLPISVEDVSGYFRLLDSIKCRKRKDKLVAFQEMTRHVHPMALGSVHRALRQTELVTLKLLNARRKPFGARKNRRIANTLSSQIYSHSHAIHRTEARNDLGLKQVRFAEEAGIADEMRQLYEEYSAFFEWDDRFLPVEEMKSSDTYEQIWEDLPIACVESADRLDVCTETHRYRRQKKIPPQITLNIQATPPLVMPQLPSGLSRTELVKIVEQQVKASLDELVKKAVKRATDEYLKTLPESQPSREVLDRGWRKHV